MSPDRSNTHRGFTLIEAVVSIVIVGLMLVAALNTVGASQLGRWKTAGHARAEQLGFDLLEEVLCQGYEKIDAYDGINNRIYGMSRTVRVRSVQADKPSLTSNTPTNVKRVTVTVRQDGVVLAKVVGLRTAAGDVR